MAETPAPAPARGGFSLSRPGVKEYAIVGVGALALFLAYKWWKGRQTASTAAASSGTGNTVYYPSPSGLSAAQLLAFISDHQRSPAPPAPAGGGGSAAPGKPGPPTDLKSTHKGSQEVISWRPPQFGSAAAGKPSRETYSVQVIGVDKAAHDIGARTSYNIGGLKAGQRYTAVVTTNGGSSTSLSFVAP
jgi:hypothetical protein